MTSDFADFVAGTPGRFVPTEMRGQIVEAEHLTRYWWAAGLAAGRRVLDAGCGMAYGANLMAEAGATEVVGVDLAESVIEAAREEAAAGVTLAVGDVRELPYEDGAFGLVACFEVIEHVEEQDAVLDELHRVLAPGGLLLISSPNRDAYVPGNPHHVREYTPAELEQALRRRWPEVGLLRQNNLMASVLLTDTSVEEADGGRIDADVHKLFTMPPGRETYTIALASHEPLPAVPEMVTLSTPVEVREWLERFDEQQQVLQRQADVLTELQQSAADRRDALERLAEAERALAEQVSLREQLREAEEGRRRMAEELEVLRERERVLEALQGSLSWRITRPLRAAKRRLR